MRKFALGAVAVVALGADCGSSGSSFTPVTQTAARWSRCRELITVPSAMLDAANRSVVPCRNVVLAAPLRGAGLRQQPRHAPRERVDLGGGVLPDVDRPGDRS